MAITTPIAGIQIPDSALARDATEFVQDTSTQLLYDHSRRVFLWGSLLGQERGLTFDPELLYIGAMFHDVGLVEGHRSEHDRFEVDGANAAREFLRAHGVTGDALRVAYPRVDFKESIIQAFADGFAHRPETTDGTMNADVLAEKLPGYERWNFCATIRASRHDT